ncbi:glycosyltransferase family 9 protein [Oscillatoria sp. CS-180]|uniref:glycosyltransferase family 9 protein n=1 Tax=Oscillatoria sp. CS-180 TaxID=3021720 RepID=UPI00232EDE7A|nr:glycosyltransferase family 9 protein [Oscillatoria sp. CS-180]MDB9526300.1 glycosyltransferase family 9 protein [Oscillatoria sp. CS-180]
MTRILFIELLGGLGDVLIALPAIQALAASHPQSQMTVLTFAPGDSLLQHHPLIQQVLPVPKGNARQAVIEALQKPYDVIVTDTNYEGIAELVQQSGTAQTVVNVWRQPPPDQLVSDRILQILLAESLITGSAAQAYHHPKLYLTEAEKALVQSRLGTVRRPLIGLYPDAGMSIKQWSPDRFIALGQLLQERYGVYLIIPEGSNYHQVQTILAELQGAIYWPRQTLRELAVLFTQLDCVVAADTGPARVAAAVGTPTVTLFGPAWHGRYGQPSPHINLQGYPSCPERNVANFTEQPCWYSGTCPFAWDTCVNLITPEEVAAAVVESGGVGEWEGVGEHGSMGAWEHGSMGAQERHAIDASGVAASTHLNAAPPHPSTQTLQGGSANTPSLLFKNGSAEREAAIASTPPCTQSLHPPITPSPQPFPSWRSVRNVLIMRLDNIGDVLMTAPVLRAIKANRPDVRLTLMASPAGAQAAAVLPWIDEVLPWRSLWQALDNPPGDIEQDWQLVQTLASRCFDGAIILTSFKQSPHPPAFICQLAGIPLRLGASSELGECLTHRVADLPHDLHQVERNLRLIEAVGFQVQVRDLGLHVPASSWVPAEPYLLLNPWASCPSRMYSLERFAIAARTLSDKTGWPVVITGMDKHQDAAVSVLTSLKDRAINLIGKTNLSDLVALVAHARLMLSNNTSTMHMADATQTPSVILFAGTELEQQWQPRQTQARLLRRPTPCSPCYAFTCPYELECLDVPSQAIVEAALSLLRRRN